MTKQEKARKSFNFQCNRASDCRHDRYQVSCNSCPEKENGTCEIQIKLEKAREDMK